MVVKICGITNREDALAAAALGATAIGFVFHPESPRSILPKDALPICQALPSDVWKVGVFVNRAADCVSKIALRLGLDVVQLHGEEQPADYPEGLRVWKAFRVRKELDAAHIELCPAEAVLLDGPANGQSFDWALAAGKTKRIVVAGGLDPDNVREAIRAARPWGVDASSRLEVSPGKKDHAKMARFLKAALEEDPI
ncbi:MAG: phosphoribosylanthranilate isomerase [Bryobacteraceae bacterium]